MEQPVYVIRGEQWFVDSPGFADAIAEAHANHERPRCHCVPEGVDMYVARLGDCFIVKRMPDTGSRHAPHCLSYEPPAELSGLGPLVGTAIREDPATGQTALKLDFALTKLPGRSTVPVPCEPSNVARSNGTRLSLRGLLHYLWDQAELTRWHPGFAGKRSWAMVRRHLLQAAADKFVCGRPLLERLYVPETFTVDGRDAINARRLTHWNKATQQTNSTRDLLLLIAEIKEVGPARYGYRVVCKHLPDQCFALDEVIYRRMQRRFAGELNLWASQGALHMTVIATFGLGRSGAPAIEELCLMPVTAQWVPVGGLAEQQLVEGLVKHGRCFAKVLRYDLSARHVLCSAMLTDTGSTPQRLFLRSGFEVENDMHIGDRTPGLGEGDAEWLWRVSLEAMPSLPMKMS